MEDAQRPINGPYLWKWIASIQATIITMGIVSWITVGFDTIKHSEIDSIMDRRAPWNHDKPRIDEHLHLIDMEFQRVRDRIERLERKLKD